MTDDPKKRTKDKPLEASAETVVGVNTPADIGETSAFPPPAFDSRSPQHFDAIAPKIPDVTIERALGQGGMGTVYKGRQTTLDRNVAVKAIRPGLARDRSFVDRFEREAKVLAKLSHPNIVACYQAGKCGETGVHYLLMEFVEGEDLLKRVRTNGPLGERDALVLARQVAEGLDHALEAGIIHRDVKPENILLKPVPRAMTTIGVQAKIVDLGLAALAQPDSESLRITEAGTSLGTPLTMAPEQAESPDKIDHRVDIYALGCTLYYAVTGKFPHEGATVAQVLAKKLKNDTADPRQHRPELSESTARIIMVMMRYDPDERPATYEELCLLLDERINALPGPRPSERLSRGQLAAPTIDEPKAPFAGARTGILVGAVAAVLAVGAGVFHYVQEHRQNQAPSPPTPPTLLPPPPIPTPPAPVDSGASTEPPPMPWGEPWQVFGSGKDRFAKLSLVHEGAWRGPEDDQEDVACNVIATTAREEALLSVPLAPNVRADVVVYPIKSTELGFALVFDPGTAEVAVQCLEPINLGTDPPETQRNWVLRAASSVETVGAGVRTTGTKRELAVQVVKGRIWARFKDVKDSKWISIAAPGKLQKVGLYVEDKVGAFGAFTIETAPD